MITARIHASLRDIEKGDWAACHRDVSEDYDYLLAAELAGIENFTWLYVTAWQNDQMIAAMPGFLTSYALDTTLDGGGKKIIDSLKSRFPDLLRMRLACLGSPVTKYGMAGFHDAASTTEREQALTAMLGAFETYAGERNYNLLGCKDIPDFQQDIWARIARPLGYRGVAGMPMAVLDTPFTDLDDYFSFLSYGTRKDMRRKLRCFNQIRVERRENIDDILPAIMDLYQQTHARAEMQFEVLTPDFFRNVLTAMPGRAFFMLYYAEDRLLGANLLVHDCNMLVDKYFCMDAAGRDYNLYFLSWFTNVDYCLDHGLASYQSGQAAYENKVRLGSRLVRTTMYFRHRNRLVQGALRLAAPLFAADDTLKEAA